MEGFEPLRAAIVGCGNVAGRYARSLQSQPETVALLGAHDLEAGRAEAFAETHECRAYASLEELLADTQVELVVNLTSHHQHARVTCQAMEAGKHVHSEKPLAGSWEEGLRCVSLAEANGLRLSCAPFSFLGEAQQSFLRAEREGRIGRVLVAYAEMNWGWIESWHPDPEGFYRPGSGPLLDVGVYALTLLTSVLGPVRRVTGFGAVTLPERVIFKGERLGQTFTVTTPDEVVGCLEFENGAVGRVTASFVVRGTKQAAGCELHGEHGALFIGSSHDFDASVESYDWGTQTWTPVPYVAEPFAGVEWGRAIFDLARSIRTGSPQRCTGRQALHVLEICLGILQSAAEGHPVQIRSCFEPPPPVEC